jgi:hypothetical protein
VTSSILPAQPTPQSQQAGDQLIIPVRHWVVTTYAFTCFPSTASAVCDITNEQRATSDIQKPDFQNLFSAIMGSPL